MARRYTQSGRFVIDGLQDLQKGDEVFVSYSGEEYKPVKVKSIRKVDCAVIVTVEKYGWYPRKFVGYYTDKKAIKGSFVVTLENWGAERVKDIMVEAESEWKKKIENAEALAAMKTIKNWLNK